MAKAKSKKSSPALITPGKGYTRTKLVAHLAAKAETAGAQISKKVVNQVLDELVCVILDNAKSGAAIPGLGKAVLRKIKARPARMGRNPMTGEPVKIKTKPASQKLVFRFAKAAKESVK